MYFQMKKKKTKQTVIHTELGEWLKTQGDHIVGFSGFLPQTSGGVGKPFL